MRENSEQRNHGGLSPLGSWEWLEQDGEQGKHPRGLVPGLSRFRDLEKLPSFYRHLLSAFCIQSLYH